MMTLQPQWQILCDGSKIDQWHICKRQDHKTKSGGGASDGGLPDAGK